MIYVLFHWMKNQERDYREFQNEDQAYNFLVDNIKDIHVHKIIAALAELKFGLSAISPREMEFVDTAEEAALSRAEEEEVTDADIIRKNKEALDKADKAIAAAEADLKSGKREGWTVCPKCNVNKVAPWNKKKICSKCQRKSSRKYDMTKRKAKID